MSSAAAAAGTAADTKTDDKAEGAASADDGAAAADGAAEVEARARRMGWRPKDEFRGSAADWIEAGAYVSKAETELPILRDRYRALDSRFVKTDKELAEVKGKLTESTQVLGELSEQSRKAEERIYKRARAELTAELEDRASKADVAGVRSVTAQIAELDADAPKPVVRPAAAAAAAPARPEQAPIPPEVNAWVNAPEQAWYRDNAALRDEAVAIHGAISRTRSDLTLSENLSEVRRRISLIHPEHFTNPRREQPAAVSGSNGAAGTPKKKTGKTYDDLPAEAKRACDRFVRTIPNYKREEYIRSYFEGDDAA